MLFTEGKQGRIGTCRLNPEIKPGQLCSVLVLRYRIRRKETQSKTKTERNGVVCVGAGQEKWKIVQVAEGVFFCVLLLEFHSIVEDDCRADLRQAEDIKTKFESLVGRERKRERGFILTHYFILLLHHHQCKRELDLLA